MKKHWRVLVGFMSMLLLICGTVTFFMVENPLDRKSEDTQQAAGAQVSMVNHFDEDDFVILEIVPDYSYAQLGYLLAGGEPIDMLKACADGKAEEIAGIAGSENVDVVSTINGTRYDELEDIYGEDKMKKYWTQTVSSGGIRSRAKYTFADDQKFVYNKNAIFDILSSQIDKYDTVDIKTVTAADLESFSDLDKCLEKVDLIYISQTYTSSKQQEIARAYGNEKASMADETVIFTSGDKYDLTWSVVETIFKKIGSKTEPVPVIMDQSLYKDAIANDSASKDTVSLRQYSLNRSVKYKSSQYTSKAIVNSENSHKDEALFVAETGDDYKITSEKVASKSNAYKLYLMTMFRDPAEFYNLFIESGVVKDGVNYIQSGADDKSKDSTYWSTYSFLPSKNEIKQSDHKPGDEAYWKGTMKIALEPSGKDVWVNCCAISFEPSKGFASLKSDVKTIFKYKPLSSYDGSSKRTYQVLDVEAAYGSKNGIGEAEIEAMIPYTSYTTSGLFKVNVTRMATAEFVSKKNNLTSDYDMIYIGDSTEGLRTESKKTVYGDTVSNKKLAGVIYSHVGSVVLFDYLSTSDSAETSFASGSNSNGHALFGDNESGSLRYSGTDITQIRKTDLDNFVSAGLPVVVASSLYEDVSGGKTTNKNGTNNQFEVSDYFSDVPNNNMYQFIKKNKDSVLKKDYNYRTDQEGVALQAITKQKPSFQVSQITTTGEDSYSDSELNKTCVYHFEKDSTSRQFTYSLDISNPEDPTASFVAKIYVDKDADGVYAKKECVITRQFALSGKNRNITFNMNPQYVGAFTWKVDVYPSAQPNLICSQIGYSVIRFEGEQQKKKVNVLQVQAVKDSSKYGTSWGSKYAQTISIKTDFSTELNALEDYNIKLKEIDMETFNNGKWTDSNTNATGDISINNFGDYYDMVVFGFSDSYRTLELGSDQAAKVREYIAKGKSVLFTHDLTSQVNLNQQDNWWNQKTAPTTYYMEMVNGNKFNKYLRSEMGLNRYKDSATSDMSSSTKYTKYAKLRTDEILHGFTYTALMQYSNFRRNWDGGSDSVIEKDKYWGPYAGLTANLKAANQGFPYVNNGYETKKVTKINDGQITKYPNDLDSSNYSTTTLSNNYKANEVQETHGQVYQLNVEDEEITCWYALAGTKWYDSSPNDASNNYYVYNKGNVTYSGIGHRENPTSFERALFVNTFVAALRAGVEGPQPDIDNSYFISLNGKDTQVVFADVDADSAQEDYEQAENVDFYVTDDSTNSDYVYVTIEQQNDDGDYVEISQNDTGNGGKKFSLALNGNKTKGDTSNAVAGPFERIDSDGKKHWVWRIKKTDLSTEDAFAYTIKYPRNCLKPTDEKDTSTGKSIQYFRLCAYGYESDTKLGVKGYQDAALMRRATFKLD